MDTTTGNQQAIPTELAWLAGIWDGEGSFVIYKLIKRNSRNLITHITLSNTDSNLIEKVISILDKLKITGHIYTEGRRNPRLNHKDCYHLTISGMEKQKKFIEMIIPYLVAKKSQASLMKRFIESRLKFQRVITERDNQGRIINGYKTEGNTEEEISFYEQVKRLNKVGNAPETIRQNLT